jgi:hypothetical protein
MPTASAGAGSVRLPKALSFRGCASAQNPEPVISGMILEKPIPDRRCAAS